MSQKDICHFTVTKLIEILKSLPQDLPVLTSGYENGFENFHSPKIITILYLWVSIADSSHFYPFFARFVLLNRFDW
jgi:hypothetical protein